MFAVIKTGNKQFLVNEGDVLKVEKLEAEVGNTVELETLLISDEEGNDLKVGTPSLGSKTKAEVMAQGRHPKVDVVKYKAKSKYRRRVGHRQPFTQIKITKLA
jgi:large subunit ribosomal protein L21